MGKSKARETPHFPILTAGPLLSRSLASRPFRGRSIYCEAKVRHQQRKRKRSAARVTKVAGKVVALAPNDDASMPADSDVLTSRPPLGARGSRGPADDPLPAESDVWLPAPKVRKLLGGISSVTFWRWRHNPALGFPPGRRVNGRWYFQWRLVSHWHAKQAEVA